MSVKFPVFEKWNLFVVEKSLFSSEILDTKDVTSDRNVLSSNQLRTGVDDAAAACSFLLWELL